MSDATRRQRSFLRYLYRDDPERYEREVELMARYVDADEDRSEWWETGSKAKAERLMTGEVERLAKKIPQTGWAFHNIGLKGVLAASEMEDRDAAALLLQDLAGYRKYGAAWEAVAADLRGHFPGLRFSPSDWDKISQFFTSLSPTDHVIRGEPLVENFRSPAEAVYQKWSKQVSQEPRRVAAESEESGEKVRRESNNLWQSWLTYTQELNAAYPNVLDAALVALGILKRAPGPKDVDARARLERARARKQNGTNGILTLGDDEDWYSVPSLRDAFWHVLHWYDYLVENQKLDALPALPPLPDLEKAALDPVLAVDSVAALVGKRIWDALAIPRSDSGSLGQPLTVKTYQMSLPRIRLPYGAPTHVYDRAKYDAMRVCGVLAPIQYIVGIPHAYEIGERFGFHALEKLTGHLQSALRFATRENSLRVTYTAIAAQALDENEMQEDLAFLHGWLERNPFHVTLPEGAEPPRSWSQLSIVDGKGTYQVRDVVLPYGVTVGSTLEECLARNTRSARLGSLLEFPVGTRFESEYGGAFVLRPESENERPKD